LVGTPEFSALAKADAARRRERGGRRPERRARAPFDEVPEFDPRGLTLDAFLTLLDRIPWFANLGQPHDLDREVDRIAGWDDWGGPETLGASAMNQEGVAWREALLATAPDRRAVAAVCEDVFMRALRMISARVDFESEGDAWDPPSAAVGGAAWLSGTLAGYVFAGEPIPPNALRQWEWYARGHWPCCYSEDDDLGGGTGAWPDLPALERARLVVL
jgi:hypothetical protein